MISQVFELLADARKVGIGFAVAGLRQGLGRGRIRFSWRGKTWTIRGKDTDFQTMRQALRDGTFELGRPKIERQIAARYHELLEAGKTPVILDLGANVGSAAIWFADRFPRALIVAVEPHPGNCEILARNLEHIPGAILVRSAAGSRPGFVELDEKWLHAGSWGIQTRRTNSGVPVTTIAELAGKVEHGSLFIVKMNIEGFEEDLFESNVEWLDEAEAVYIALHDDFILDSRPSRTFQAAFANRDFRLFSLENQVVYVRDRTSGEAKPC